MKHCPTCTCPSHAPMEKRERKPIDLAQARRLRALVGKRVRLLDEFGGELVQGVLEASDVDVAGVPFGFVIYSVRKRGDEHCWIVGDRRVEPVR